MGVLREMFCSTDASALRELCGSSELAGQLQILVGECYETLTN